MNKYKDHTLQEYLEELSKRVPVPGGGSAAALVGATGVALILMVANYSKGKIKTEKDEHKLSETIKNAKSLRNKLLKLVDLDAEAYMGLVKARKKGPKSIEAAKRKAAETPRDVCRLCYSAIELTPFLVKKGNQNLISDVEVAAELLLAAFNSAAINVEINT